MPGVPLNGRAVVRCSSGAVRRVVVIGSGTRFLSGISIYSVRLANALAEQGHHVGLLTMSRLIPARLYPGRSRVGAELTVLEPDPRVARFDGVDWFWVPSLFRATWFLLRTRPQTVVFEWWTGTVVHSYLALALIARILRARVVVEFHEIVPVEEAGIALLARYVRTFAPLFFRLADGFAVHSEFDRDLALKTWRLGRRRPIAVLPHGPHDHYKADPAAGGAEDSEASSEAKPIREAPARSINLLFFGVIRPYKGLEHLVEAYDALPEDVADRFWLTVVGETWEGFTKPIEMIEASPRRERVTLVNRYVTDAELDGYMRGADAVVLPYTRSSLSGPLHVAMGYGLPIVMTDTGGNAEAAAGYGGITLVPPSDPAALASAIAALADHPKQRYAHPHTWADTAVAFESLFDQLESPTTTD
jgi:glycosyltransferase involved in cell wall biosynthesis